MLNLRDRRAVVVGVTEVAERRAAQLARAGAVVVQSTGEAAPRLAELMADIPRAGCIDSVDFTGAALAFIAVEDRDQAACLAATAREQRVPVHVADRPELSDFIMPAVVERGDVIVAIGTAGVAPVLARRLRERIERALPAGLGDLVRLLGSFREAARSVLPDPGARRRFWEQAIDGPVAEAALAGDQRRARDLLVAGLSGGEGSATGHVQLVGAGPGDPDLLTVKALRALQDADVVVHDELIGAGVLGRARHDAARIHVGKRKDAHSKSQAEINALLVTLARQGKRVVRLKGGDPFVFGRGGEELEHLRAEGVAVTVIPGVTAALGCAASAGFPVTHRGIATTVTFVTGHDSGGSPGPDWRALARLGGTLAIYMGAAEAGRISRALMAGGLDAAIPVAAIANGTRSDERVVTGCLAELPVLVARLSPNAPVLLVVGDVVRFAPEFASGCDRVGAAS
jgi:uroporphyrin-III C-methyltransferase/precorrin-2 dehydrogenase/sirohydrochlorin ferrochelatase